MVSSSKCFFLMLSCISLLENDRLQPVRDTREKQIQLWKELVLEFCRSQKIFIISLEEDFPLFSNPTIESKFLVLSVVSFLFFLLFSVLQVCGGVSDYYISSSFSL